jgi:hypothetical protein
MSTFNIYGFRGSECPICKCFIALEDLYDEYNAIAFVEYEKSGLCIKCQDMLFGMED